MERKRVTRWYALNGTEFRTKSDCAEYEKNTARMFAEKINDIKSEIERMERELTFAESFKKTRLYALLDDFQHDSKNKAKLEVIKSEIAAHPEYGFGFAKYERDQGESLCMYDNFTFDPDVMRGAVGNWFLVYHLDNWDFDDDVAHTERNLSSCKEEVEYLSSMEWWEYYDNEDDDWD